MNYNYAGPIECALCSQQFKQQQSLIDHIRTDHRIMSRDGRQMTVIVVNGSYAMTMVKRSKPLGVRKALAAKRAKNRV